MSEDQAMKNTDTVLHENVDCRIIMTAQHALGINVGGSVIVLDPVEWHRIAQSVTETKGDHRVDISQEWVRKYVEKLLDIAKQFEATSPMRDACLMRAEHAMDLVKAFREPGPK